MTCLFVHADLFQQLHSMLLLISTLKPQQMKKSLWFSFGFYCSGLPSRGREKKTLSSLKWEIWLLMRLPLVSWTSAHLRGENSERVQPDNQGRQWADRGKSSLFSNVSDLLSIVSSLEGFARPMKILSLWKVPLLSGGSVSPLLGVITVKPARDFPALFLENSPRPVLTLCTSCHHWDSSLLGKQAFFCHFIHLLDLSILDLGVRPHACCWSPPPPLKLYPVFMQSWQSVRY